MKMRGGKGEKEGAKPDIEWWWAGESAGKGPQIDEMVKPRAKWNKQISNLRRKKKSNLTVISKVKSIQSLVCMHAVVQGEGIS